MFRAYITVPDFDLRIVELLNSHDISVTVHPEGMERPGENELCGLVADYDILIIGVKEKMSKTVFDSVDELKILGTLSVGTDHISDEFFSSSIPVINIAGYNALSVAEFIFGQILSLYKGIWSSRLSYSNHALPKRFDLHDKKIGIIGAGNIGSEVIQIARVFTNKIYCHTKHPDKHTVLKNANVIFTNINRLFSETDVIIVTVPLTNETKDMINNDLISLMKKDSIIVSISRTPVIDIDNLCTVVEKGTILGAAIDGEFPEHIYTRYKETPNLQLTTHIAGNSVDANAKADTLMGEKIIQHITHLQF